MGAEESLYVGRRHDRGRVSLSAAPGGQPVHKTARQRACPTCQAAPQEPCRRWIAGRVKGQDVGGGQWRTLKRHHDGR